MASGQVGRSLTAPTALFGRSLTAPTALSAGA